MGHSLVFEINTRCWLRALSEAGGGRVTLDTVPKAEFVSWQNAGFTHLWLMGVWKTGPKARALARAQPAFRNMCLEAFGAESDEYISGSPYAIADYVVAECFGGNAALARFRGKLRQYGLGLILDFVPNHLGLDHEWISTQPGLFVSSHERHPDSFHEGARWIAHGRDPHFPAWTDTAQLDYRVPATRAAMQGILRSVAAQCDGVRCDMAMLLLEDVFAATWADIPAEPPAARGEFWVRAIAAIKKEQPHFLFIAEAYWNRESRLQELGFDYSYDKGFYDCLARRDPTALWNHLQHVANNFAPVRFLENHDERRIASLFNFSEQQAAAVLLLSQPGMRLLHDGQFTGRTRRVPVQFTHYWPESPHLETKSFYDDLLAALPRTAIGGSDMEYLQTEAEGCFLMKWKGGRAPCTLVAVNLFGQISHFAAGSIGPDARQIFADAASKWKWTGDRLQIELAPHGFLLLTLDR
jgi:hypothetical protein